MAIDLNIPIVAALVDRLQNDLDAAIDAYNGAAADGTFQLTKAADSRVLDYIPPPNFLDDYPVIGIGDAPARFEDDIGSSATGVHQLLVVVYWQDDEQQNLARRLRGYAATVARVVLADRNLGSAAWGTTLLGVDPGPTLADDPEDPKVWMSWVGLRIQAKREEE